ncbi:hypothetical protein [Vreelandella alkaliphila]|uniref:Uncharacterized protein n=1 Tax=Vreelandella alkaliphila TaxID=272774 RepID=A0A7C9JTJ7_9GAMM|nr:hypothetical protein [Halomonas alkaliphila]NDL71260.1 hypothetical protein [Halomonas alkaliphila]
MTDPLAAEADQGVFAKLTAWTQLRDTGNQLGYFELDRLAACHGGIGDHGM